jgi:enoyl-CoA hydratase
MPKPAIRVETSNGVRHLILCRADEYNTITPPLRDELGAAIDAADADHEVHVILLRAEGPAFCAGYNLDWGTGLQIRRASAQARMGFRHRLQCDVAICKCLHEAVVRE